MTTVHEMLVSKGHGFIAVSPEEFVLSAIKKMAEHDIKHIPITADDIIGKYSSHDVVDSATGEVLVVGWGGTYGAIVRGIQLARLMVYEASKLRRERVGDEHLCVGVKCGYSDTTSGIAGNPAVGYLYDKVVAAGGTALFGETTEIIGAEQALARRAVSPDVAGAILRAVTFQEDRAKATGLDIRTVSRCDPPSGRAGPVRRSRGPRWSGSRTAPPSRRLIANPSRSFARCSPSPFPRSR